jgi:Na+-driven multidrug efflux pump
MSCAIIPAIGLAVATSTLVGQNIGAEQLRRAERTNLVSCSFAFTALTLPAYARLWEHGDRQILHSPRRTSFEQSAVFIRAVALTFGFIGLQHVLTGSLRGAGDTVAPIVVAMISLWLLGFPMHMYSQPTPACMSGVSGMPSR